MIDPEDTKIWKKVRAALKEKSQYSLKIAVIEAHKIFESFLKEKGFDLDDKHIITTLKEKLSLPEDLRASLDYYNDLLRTDVEADEYKKVKQIIQGYYQAMLDIKGVNKVNMAITKGQEKIIEKLKIYKDKFGRYTLYFIGGVISLMIVGFLVGNKKVRASIGSIFEKLLLSLIPLSIVLLIIGAFALFYYMNKKKSKKYTNAKIIFEDDEEEMLN